MGDSITIKQLSSKDTKRHVNELKNLICSLTTELATKSQGHNTLMY